MYEWYSNQKYDIFFIIYMVFFVKYEMYITII